MKKLIFTILFLFAANLNATVVVPHTHPYIFHTSHSTGTTVTDNSLQTSLTRKDYCFRCKKCGKNFVIPNMLYHGNTDMYFYYKQVNSSKVLQPFEGRNICDECGNKQGVTILGFFLIIAVLGIAICYYFNRD